MGVAVVVVAVAAAMGDMGEQTMEVEEEETVGEGH